MLGCFKAMFKQLPPLKSLLAFAAASRCKHFSRAADELHITQSAVSHQIKNLEEFLGHRMFFRQGNQLQLTEEGKTFANAINPAFDQMLIATKALTGHKTPHYNLVFPVPLQFIA
jgi:LysR family glycine cleavage system transcriptional activator